MAELRERFWQPDDAYDLPRRDRRGGSYSVYIPDSLRGRRFRFDGDTAADVAEAERAIAALDASAMALVDTEALARMLLRAESVASSHIEGLAVGARRLLNADIASALGEHVIDVTAAEVLANIEAMAYGIGQAARDTDITSDLLLEIHRRLLAPTSMSEHGGKFRATQNWIGGSNYNPCAAAFVPPPPELVGSLMDDLCEFSNDDTLPAVAQAAIAHSQFETIHPFPDGNGRVGRVLIHLIFRRRGLTMTVTPPVSLVLATRSEDYVHGLQTSRYDGSPDSEAAHAGVNRWVATFASACSRAVADAQGFERRIAGIQTAWRQKLGSTRSDSAAALLTAKLPGAPVLTAASAAKLIDRSLSSTIEGIERLVAADILRPSRLGRKRGQVYEARDIMDAFTALERQLASPKGDTKTSPPTRTVPARTIEKR